MIESKVYKWLCTVTLEHIAPSTKTQTKIKIIRDDQISRPAESVTHNELHTELVAAVGIPTKNIYYSVCVCLRHRIKILNFTQILKKFQYIHSDIIVVTINNKISKLYYHLNGDSFCDYS